MNESQHPNQLDPLTEVFSQLQLLSLEEEERQGRVDYQALYDEMTGLFREFLADPKTVRLSQKFLKIVTVMRFFGIYPEDRWKENQHRLDKLGLSDERRESLKRGQSDKWMFWQPPEQKGSKPT